MNSTRQCLISAGLVCLMLVAFASPADAAARQDALQRLLLQFERMHSDFAREMESIAEFCEQNSFLNDAERIRQRARHPRDGFDALETLPEQVIPPLPQNLDPVQKQWRVKLQATEKNYATQLYRLARQAMDDRHASLAYQLIRYVLVFDSDHRFARQLLGYVQDGDHWTTPFARSMKLKGFVDHPEFGWMERKNVARYENGERLFNGRWITAEKEQILRSRFEDGWVVETEHFEIQTNYSLERGVELGRMLEKFHHYFMEQYSAFFNTPQQMQKLFSGAASSSRFRPNRHRIAYFRSQEEFVQHLSSLENRISIANGFYLPRTRTAYFFHVEDPEAAQSNVETMFHEVTHQLLGESSTKTIDVGELSDFWVIEGFPCYMESFKIAEIESDVENGGQKEDVVSIGNPEHPRIYWARVKCLEELFYVPMRQFMALGRSQFMNAGDHDTLHAYYSQAAGLSHFFLHYEQGRYRDAFIEYLSQIYSPDSRIRQNSQTLEQLLEVPFETLDEQYFEYLRSL